MYIYGYKVSFGGKNLPPLRGVTRDIYIYGYKVSFGGKIGPLK
jgi:hypothetical protein